MKKYFSLIVSTLLVWAVTACKPVIKDEPEPQPAEDTTAVKDTTTAPEDTIPEPPQLPESFPRKHLIEEFTGQGCGYCPYGMNCVHSFMESDTNWVLILHHYGYQADHFSVTGSKTITTKLGVDGAPSIAIDRAATKSEDGTKICFHPGYLPSVSKSQFVATTYASVQIANDYSSADRTLRVHLSGYVLKDEHPDLLLTVMVKESGMIDTQQDYYYTYEGWQEFRHANAVRAYLTAATGDSLHVQDDKSWSADYELTLSSTWVPENCAVVAVIAEKFQPVIQAAQQPVVSGTQGGADILRRAMSKKKDSVMQAERKRFVYGDDMIRPVCRLRISICSRNLARRRSPRAPTSSIPRCSPVRRTQASAMTSICRSTDRVSTTLPRVISSRVTSFLRRSGSLLTAR